MKIAAMPPKRNPMPITKVRKSFYGRCHLLGQIGKIDRVKEDLKFCFPDSYRQILSVAYYLILEESD